jgi:ketosteroid isomerase-like protein
MSDNLELVRSIFAAWECGDFSSTDWAHPDIEYVIVDEPGSQTRTGVMAMTEAWREFLRAWQEYRVEADEYRQVDDKRVLVLLKVFGRGKTSGLDLGTVASERRGANVFHVRNGKVTRLATYFDGQRALADLGLAE